MFTTVYVKIEGILPQLQNNGRRKNPLDPWSKKMKKVSSKRNKTDDDHIAMMEAEYKGALYLFNDDQTKAGDGSIPFWPADNIHACIKTAAKAKKMGKLFDSFVAINPPGGKLYVPGLPQTRNKLWDDPKFRLVKPTKRGVMCCRPMFPPGWQVEFTLSLNEKKMNYDDLRQLIIDAGQFIGLSDWPRRYGLFKVLECERKEVEIDIAS